MHISKYMEWRLSVLIDKSAIGKSLVGSTLFKFITEEGAIRPSLSEIGDWCW